MSRIKRFLGTIHFAEFIWFHLKRFRGTKLPEDCPLWPAAYKSGKDRPSVAYQSAWSDRQAYMGSFRSLTYVRCLWFPGHPQTHETTQNKKTGKVFCKTLPVFLLYRACRCLQRRFWYSHRDSNPNRQNRNLKSYPLDYGSKRGQEQMPPCGIDFPYLRCKVNYFND